MQTFLPYANFNQSVRILDRQRLGKQRVENIQIMHALFWGGAWSNHPATWMWLGYEGALLQYHIAVVHEWTVIRGYKDTTYASAFALYGEEYVSPQQYEEPFWLGDTDFHTAHQSNLIRKDAATYRPYFPDVPDDLPYIWPVTKEMIDA